MRSINLKKGYKKKLAKRALYGVDVVKVGLYDTFKKSYSIKYEKTDEKYCQKLAAAAVNEIFGDHAEETLQVFDENRELIWVVSNNNSLIVKLLINRAVCY